MQQLPKLDPIFHQPVRTRLVAIISVQQQSFSQLKAALDITDGNLDAHLRKLSSAGYLHSQMVLQGRPHTVYKLSNSGAVAFKNYLKALTTVIKHSDKQL